MRSCPLATMRFFQHRLTFWFSLSAVLFFYILFYQMELGVHGGTGISTLSLQFTFSANRFFDIVMSWFPDGSAQWAKMLWLDMLFPFAYVILLISLLRQAKVNTIFFYPLTVLAGFLDILENSFHLIIIESGRHLLLVPLAAAFALLKWLIVAVILGAVLFTPLYRYFSRPKPVNYG